MPLPAVDAATLQALRAMDVRFVVRLLHVDGVYTPVVQRRAPGEPLFLGLVIEGDCAMQSHSYPNIMERLTNLLGAFELLGGKCVSGFEETATKAH